MIKMHTLFSHTLIRCLENCVATIGVVRFLCVTSVTHFFNKFLIYGGKNMDEKLAKFFADEKKKMDEKLKNEKEVFKWKK